MLVPVELTLGIAYYFEDSIGQLRLDMKYLVFDLEATRRERDNYQQQLSEMLGESPSSDDASPEDDQ